MSTVDALQERIDIATGDVVQAARTVARTRTVMKPATTVEDAAVVRLAAAVAALDRLEASQREEREGDAVDLMLRHLGHLEGCDYTNKATAPEMAVHGALFLMNGGPLPSCGPVDWWHR